jgi:predicted lipoprotein with Yx(FWY)xxD motif
MDIRIPLGRAARTGSLAVASILFVAACASSAAGGGAPAAPAAAGGGPYGGGYGDAAAPASRAPTTSAAGGAYEVKTATDATAGAFLTGEDGKTLYIFTKDKPGASACSGDCATNWPPFTVVTGETVKAGSGVTGTFATIKRADGGEQVTYDGQPLYYFAADQKAGDVTGQAVGGVWYVAAP